MALDRIVLTNIVLFTAISCGAIFIGTYIIDAKKETIGRMRGRRKIKKGRAPYRDGQFYLDFMKDYL
jgi:hypothetical protein